MQVGYFFGFFERHFSYRPTLFESCEESHRANRPGLFSNGECNTCILIDLTQTEVPKFFQFEIHAINQAVKKL